jgi:hypothetical protein
MKEPRSKKVLKKPAAKLVVKKSVPKKVVKKSTVPKTPKKTTKSIETDQEKIIKAVNRTVRTAPKVKLVAKKSAPKRSAATTKITQKNSKKKPMEVTLPTRMSIRAREKSLAWSAEFEQKMHKPIYALTMTFGALFVLFGSYSGMHYSAASNTCQNANCASLVGLSDPNSGTTSTKQSNPSVDLVADIPSKVTSNISVMIDTVDTKRVDAELRFPGQSGLMETRQLSVQNAQKGQFLIIVPGRDLQPNQYSLHVQPYNVQGEPSGYTNLGSFSVPTDTSNTATNSGNSASSVKSASQVRADDDGSTSISEQTSVSTDSSTVDGITQSTTTTNILSTIDGVTQLDETIDVKASADGLTNPAKILASEPVESEPVNKITIRAKSLVSGRATVSIQSTVSQSLSVYIRRLQSTEEQLVGRVTGDDVTYYLNTRDFPNGSYELTVRSSSASDDIESNSIILQIQNETNQIISTEPDVTPIVNEEREVLKITPKVIDAASPVQAGTPVNTELKSPDPVGLNVEPESTLAVNTPGSVTDELIRRRTLDKLSSDTVLLDQLFTRFAIAVQSGDPDMVREARNAMTAYQRSIVDTALASPEDRFIADDLAKSLQQEIDHIANKVETFESLRRERSEGKVSKDSDGDGITDIDERVLFNTDPLRADTDGDGFTDGAEIIRGFNPVDAASEAAIVYKSPKETIGIAANNNLQVTEVTPEIILSGIAEEASAIQARVKGKALPNSFVTLYIFSTPTIVTVRTEADGSFEYTFSKELEDGEHQVFVALTDNTGDIVAQSAPFTFIKQAEAFTAVEAEAVIFDTQSTELNSSGFSSFQTVLSMSVLALGILLIMLGVGLRFNRPEQIKLEAAA